MEQASMDVVTRTAVYSAIHHDVQVDFADEDAARAFFNSGGWVGFRIDMDEDNMVQTLQRWRLAQLGVIRMAALKSDSVGSLKLVCDEGDGVIADEGNCGYYGVTTFRRKLWSHMLPVGTQPGTATDTGYVLFELFATKLSLTSMKVEFHITDTTGAAYSNATNTPPFSISCFCLSGRPDPAILYTPVIDHPTVTRLPSTSW
jgi:hypothetical protein